MTGRATSDRDITVVELLDRVVDNGVVLAGDITISVADVDLIHLGLRLVLRSPVLFETASERQPESDTEDAHDFILRLRDPAREH